MGQAESVLAAPEADTNQTTKSEETSTNTDTASSQPSLEDLITEATNYGGNDENESLEVKAQKALECPCVAELRKGPCGTTFSEAFVCFIKSTAEEKGSDCVSPFIALQNCIKANPKAFSKDVFDDEDEEDDANVEDVKIIPPAWAREPKSQGISKL